MNFKEAARMGSYLAKDYAEAFFKLIVSYQSISASEAASRLGLHIKTAQDFLEGLTQLEVLNKQEVFEGKRPYFRYSLKKSKLEFNVDLSEFFSIKKTTSRLQKRIKEKPNADVIFNVVGSNQYISSIVLRSGSGRNRKAQRINLTSAQGKFLFHLPFPSAASLSIEDIMMKAEVEPTSVSEILDIVDLLEEREVIVGQ